MLQKRWKLRKKRIPLPKFKRTKIVEKVKVQKLPGEKITKQEAKNIQRFNRLSLKLPKKKVVKKPGLSLKERQLLESENEISEYEESEDEDYDQGEETAQPSYRKDKVRVYRRPGVSLAEKRALQPEHEAGLRVKEINISKEDNNKVLKKPGLSIKERKSFDSESQKVHALEEKEFVREEKTKIVKRPGRLLKEIQAEDSLEKEVIPKKDKEITRDEQIKITKKPGLSIKERKHSESEPEPNDFSELIKPGKLKVIKRPGLPLKEKENEKQTEEKVQEAFYDKVLQERHKTEKVKIVKKPGVLLKDKQFPVPEGKQQIYDTDDSELPKRDKVKVVKRRRHSFRERQKISRDLAGYLSDYEQLESDTANDFAIGGDAIRYAKRKSRKDKFKETIEASVEEKEDENMSQRNIYNHTGADNTSNYQEVGLSLCCIFFNILNIL